MSKHLTNYTELKTCITSDLQHLKALSESFRKNTLLKTELQKNLDSIIEQFSNTLTNNQFALLDNPLWNFVHKYDSPSPQQINSFMEQNFTYKIEDLERSVKLDKKTNKETDKNPNNSDWYYAGVSKPYVANVCITDKMKFYYLDIGEKNKNINNISEFRNIKFCYHIYFGRPNNLYKFKSAGDNMYYIGDDKKLYVLDTFGNLVHAIYNERYQCWR